MNIKSEIITAIKAFIGFSILLGIIYPLTITGIAQIAMPYQANGSLIKENSKIIGSTLIGQKFDSPKYFQGRPSAAGKGYDATSSGGTNLGPSSKKLIDQVADKVKQARTENNIPQNKSVPADMVLTSASGLDPHISVQNAMLQAARVSKLNNIPEDRVKILIAKNTDPDFIGIWGQSGVNVLKLNIALDNLSVH
ncbi:MAG: K(+)-transporting ATPase subunit C [Candidatus Gastranaerophilaceae bacterium]|jgi:K+-transporting ATPase ATPase C chain